MRKNYEIPVYNSQVRQAIRNGDKHPSLGDEWADTHFITVSANSPEEAVIVCRRKHPERMGYVLGDVTEEF